LIRLYQTYCHPDYPRADLTRLPYWLAEATQIIDAHRLNQRRKEREANERKQRQREQAKKAGLPV
jgi:hypothetical protein